LGESSGRYPALLSAAMRRIADDPNDPVTRDSSDVSASFLPVH
jgi:hypothetical protein